MANFLDDDGSSPDVDSGSIPSYLLAADNHNIGNTRGGSWFDPDTWSEKFDNTGYFIGASILSGANSFYNTGATVGSWLGADTPQQDTQDFISGIDSDMGAYYSKNRTATDLIGFIAGSLVPGVAGIKILNAGQKALGVARTAGLLGENMSAITGLLIPQTERYVALAASDISSATATFNAINANGIRALASGVYSNVLEGVAFETAVQTTMFKSPILDQQDGWDIVKNVALGGAVQGVIGGAFTAASTLGSIRRQVSLTDRFLKPFGSRTIPEEGLTPANKIILLSEDKQSALFPMEGSQSEGQATQMALDKVRRIDNDIRTQTHEMISGSDSTLGNMVADSMAGAPTETVLDNLLHAETIGRIGQLSPIESEINAAAKAGLNAPELQTSYVKLTGEGTGVVTDTEPTIVNLADRIAPRAGQSSEEAVLKQVRDYEFSPQKYWSALDLSGRAGHLEAEARYIWADTLMKPLKEGTSVGQYDIPVLERALKDGTVSVKLTDKAGGVLQDGFTSKQALQDYIISTKETVANELMRSHVFEGNIPVEQGTQAIAKIVNTKLDRLEGTAVGNPALDYFASQSAQSDYTAQLAARGLTTPAGTDIRFLPTYAKVSKRIAGMEDVNGNVVDGMTWIKSQQQMLKSAVDNVTAKAMGPLGAEIPEITQSALLTSNRYGSGAKLFSFANGGYGTLESTAQLLGSITQRLKKSFRGDTADLLQGPLVNLGTKQEAAIEFETINQKITRSAATWIRHTDPEDGAEYMVTKDAFSKYLDKDTGTLDFDALNSSDPQALLNINQPETAAAIDAHIQRAGQRTVTYRELRAAQGLEDVKDPLTYRPIRPSPNDYPYFAFVKDPAVTGQGHMTMIHAADESSLKGLIDKVPTQYQVLTKRDTEEFFAARNEYDYQRTLHESMIDSNLKNNGVFSNFFTKTDPQKIVNDILGQHLREDDTLAVELMRAKNQNAFNYLEDQGNAYTKIEASKFGTYSDRLEKQGKNPYLDYIKTSLDISKASEHPLLYGFNRFLDQAVSKAVGSISDLFSSARSTEDLTGINALLDKYGMNTGYRDAATDLLANHQAPKGELTKFIRGANAILSKLTLGLDPLNAVNNFIGANILRSTELKQITDAIRGGDNDLAGKLGSLLNVKLPGVSDSITSPSRLVFNALRNYAQDDGTLLARYRNLGVIKDATQQFKDILDDFTLKGTETVDGLNARLSSAFAKAKSLSEAGERYSGNRFAEELNRFISADSMRQLTDLGVQKGILSPAEQNAYINTFVNRVEGNTLASQRPLMFQGPIGQAIGLFQSYQFNLMQQMFRYVAEGSAKDSAMLLGLQGTFFGIQGLPAFQFINQHVVGSLSGNPKHVDLYDSTYGVLGKQLGDLALYGLPSNLLQANLYSRGDINPRQITILPTSLPDVPIVGAFGKFLGSVKNTVGKMANGANVWESMLQGLEHNGLSRPLAGLAQTLQASTGKGVPFSTSSKGTILFSNDLASWATATRLAGGRPLDEAIINDGVFRIQSYTQQDNQRMNDLGEAIKASTINGQTVDGDQINQFSREYASNGGKQPQFNKYFMNQFKAANTSQSQKITAQLQNPFAQKMQILMGGGSDSSLSGISSLPSGN